MGHRNYKVELTCDNPKCRKKFLRTAYMVFEHNYCTRECKQAVVNMVMGTRVCENIKCGKEFTYTYNTRKKKFCSRACGATAQHFREQMEKEEMEKGMKEAQTPPNDWGTGASADLNYDPFTFKEAGYGMS